MDKVKVVDHLENIKKHLGEDAWKGEVQRLALQGLKLGGAHEAFWRDLLKGPGYEWADADSLKKVADAMPGGTPDINTLLAEALKQTMPGMKSQGQYNAFRTAFDAFRAAMNAIFDGDAAKAEESRKLLDMAFIGCKQATDITRKLGDVPEAAASAAANEFKRPPSEFHEHDVLQGLLVELAKQENVQALSEWYSATKERRDSIRSGTLRNTLVDAIRARKTELSGVAKPS
jgi:hypothetical protein